MEQQKNNIRFEKEISESEVRYRTLFEKAPISITLVDISGNIIDCNKACEKLIGYSKEEIIGRSFQSLTTLDPHDLPDLIKNYEKLMKGGEVETYELEMIRKTGERRTIEVTNSLIMKGDKIEGFQIHAIDITERKQAEKLLIESEKKIKEKSFELQIINEIISYGNTAGNLSSFLQKALDTILQSGNFLGGGIYLHNEVTLHNILATTLSTSQDFIEMVREVDMIKEPYKRALTSQKAFIINDIDQTLPELRQWRIKSVISAPLLTKNRYLGTLNLASKINIPPNSIELNFFTLVGQQIGSIVQRFQAEQSLKESEEKYRTLFDQSPEAIVLDDSKGTIIDINSTVEKVLGYKKKDMLGKNFLDLKIFSPEVLPVVKQYFPKRLKGEPIEYYEVPIIKSNGDTVWIFPQGAPIKLGNEPHLLYILQDITERKIAQQKLKESEEKYRILFEESPFIITLINAQGKIMDINSAVEKVFGYKKEDLVGRNFLELGIYSPEALLHLKQNFLNRLKGELAVQNEIPLIKANGDMAWIYPQMAMLKLEQENMLLYTIQDITERKVAEQRLKESEERYRLITENSNDFIMVNNSEPVIEFLNETSYHRFLGYTFKDLEGTNPLDIIHPEDQKSLVEAYPAALDIKGTTNEIRVKRKDGTYLWVEMKAKSFVDGSGQTKYLSISRDITERKALEEARKSNMALLEREVEQKTQELRNETEELQKALESLKIAQEHLVQSEKLASIGLLAAGIAHEINNPLMGMINYAQIIKDELETKLKVDLNVKPYSFLSGIIKEGERISEIVEGLLSFAREERGEFIPTEISEIINSALALLLPKIKNSQIEVNLELDSNLPKIPMKTRNIRQVILNVLQNSITAINEKYSLLSKKGDKVITIKTSSLILDEKPYAKISIKDNGIGIRSENLLKVFDPFFTTKGITGTKGEGTGLGLSISYGIIKDHKGRIEIQSEWGSWTLLNIILPLEL